MHVLGAGSMGCLWAAALARAGTETRLLLRPGTAKLTMCHSGKALLRVQGCQDLETMSVAVPIEEVSGSGVSGADVGELVVVTKAYSAMCALETLAPRLRRDAVIVVLCNGALALHEQIVKTACLDNTQLILGITTHGAWSRGPFEVVHAGRGQTRFGTLGAVQPELYKSTLKRLETAGLGAVDEGPNIERSLWLKLAANAAINPLTALEEKPNGFILSCAHARKNVSQICREVSALADTLLRSRGSALQLSAEDLEDFVLQTVRETAENRSSMMQDVQAGRPTEIDFLNGWVSSKSQEMGMEAEVNTRMTSMIQAKEAAMTARKAGLDERAEFVSAYG